MDWEAERDPRVAIRGYYEQRSATRRARATSRWRVSTRTPSRPSTRDEEQTVPRWRSTGTRSAGPRTGRRTKKRGLNITRQPLPHRDRARAVRATGPRRIAHPIVPRDGVPGECSAPPTRARPCPPTIVRVPDGRNGSCGTTAALVLAMRVQTGKSTRRRVQVPRAGDPSPRRRQERAVVVPAM